MTTVLSGEEILALCNGDEPLIRGMIDPKTQIQPNGVDLTLKEVHEITGKGSLGLSSRKLSDSRVLPFEKGAISLPKGCYKVSFNEYLHIPLNLMAIGRPRSSLLRCGVTVESAVWDAGFKGYSEGLLIVQAEAGFRIEKDTRILQLVFFKLSRPVEKGYSGIFNTKYEGQR